MHSKRTSFSAIVGGAGLAALLSSGCAIQDELAPAKVESDNVVLHIAGDLSGSISDQKLDDLRDRLAEFVGHFGKPQVMSHACWFAKDYGCFYDGPSKPGEVREAIDAALDRSGAVSKVPAKVFIGTNLSGYFQSVADEIEHPTTKGAKALHIIFLGSDGGFTEDVHKLHEASQRLAKDNVIVIVAGVVGSAGVRNSEITHYKLEPLQKAGKLLLIHDGAYAAEMHQTLITLAGMGAISK
jgi:hypothetical protein